MKYIKNFLVVLGLLTSIAHSAEFLGETASMEDCTTMNQSERFGDRVGDYSEGSEDSDNNSGTIVR